MLGGFKRPESGSGRGGHRSGSSHLPRRFVASVISDSFGRAWIMWVKRNGERSKSRRELFPQGFSVYPASEISVSSICRLPSVSSTIRTTGCRFPCERARTLDKSWVRLETHDRSNSRSSSTFREVVVGNPEATRVRQKSANLAASSKRR